MRFGVITEVDTPEKGGNMATALGSLYLTRDGNITYQPVGIEALAFGIPVFSVGEILVLDSDGREFAYLVNVSAENALRPMPMWHVLFDVSDEDLELLGQSRVLVMACSVVPIFQMYPLHRRIDGTSIETPSDC